MEQVTGIIERIISKATTDNSLTSQFESLN